MYIFRDIHTEVNLVSAPLTRKKDNEATTNYDYNTA